MSLSEKLLVLANDFAHARAKPFKDSKFGNFVRHDLAIEAKKHLSFWPFDLTVKASVGAGNWAAVPWLAFFDPLVTDGATHGFYVVYLINAQENSITLSMNQGATKVYEEFGKARGLEVLRRRALDISDRVSDFSKKFSNDPIDLGSSADLPAGYEAGHSFGVTYPRQELSESSCIEDLRKMLEAYEALVDRGGVTPIDVMISEFPGVTVEETRRLVLSQRIERSRSVRRAVLAAKKAVCEGCGLDPIEDYRFDGKPLETPLDVHHATPLFQLAEGESKRYRIPDDFLVLCPTCHRMIHKQNDPSDLEALRKKIRFKHMREMGW
ncbi:hypothetical protein GCM10007385_30460 [Tateyamaria omphalii]|uniref:MrcB family domain-containing protein n=1 Tax=Tateyamaria omphalii TaxID=299262 RepID=UPI00167917AC|nr:DUF3578 domain-containing protein [Tateyamaria omphalii]GGX59291.1 hypothetical protein GCM10007385_30460 [Tateyamaria omphalii]